MQVVIYVALGGIVAAAGIAVLWTLFFTRRFALVRTLDENVTPYLFLVGRQLLGSLLGLQRAIR